MWVTGIEPALLRALLLESHDILPIELHPHHFRFFLRYRETLYLPAALPVGVTHLSLRLLIFAPNKSIIQIKEGLAC